MTIWDGVNECYVPGPTLEFDPSLELHREAADDIDPVTYEVLRYVLWNLNQEHGDIIMKVSGSPIAQYAHDLNTVILTEDVEYVYSGPYNLNLSAVIDLTVKWIMENRSADPGIHDGDIFISNDPFVGASHVTDVILASPIYVDGKVFAWVASTFHQYDMGGVAPGGYSPDARDRFDEADPIPPVKIVDRGEVRRDLEEWYLRKSRTPGLLALDLRSQIAGCNYAKRRILSLIETYGAGTLKAAMRKILDDSQQAFAEKLAQIPNGTWRARSYLDMAKPGDRSVYRTTLNVTKSDDRLVLDHEGTDPQVGVLSISYAAWRAGVIPPLIRMLTYDTLYALGGALRLVEFRPTPGTLMCASHPAATGNPGIGICQAGSLATIALSRMLSSVDPEVRDTEAFAVAGTSQYPINGLSGVDQWGNYFGTIHMEPMGGGLGAFENADGEDTGGPMFDAMALMPNVEFSERYFPILHLYERELPDAGGAGTYRGGNSGVFAYIPHRSEMISHYTASSGYAVPTGQGLWGGHPGATNLDGIKVDTDVLEHLKRGHIPQSLGELSGEERLVDPKQRDVLQAPTDVYEMRWCAGGGFGDPLERDPALVAQDVAAGAVTPETARDLYGVLLHGHEVDKEATEAARSERRREILRGHETATGDRVARVGPLLELRDSGTQPTVCCVRCDTSFGALETWKQQAVTVTTPVHEAHPLSIPADRYVEDEIVFRRFCCPGCGVTLDTEVAAADDTPLVDFELHD